MADVAKNLLSNEMVRQPISACKTKRHFVTSHLQKFSHQKMPYRVPQWETECFVASGVVIAMLTQCN